jgi:PAS domain S-box-containing protein
MDIRLLVANEYISLLIYIRLSSHLTLSILSVSTGLLGIAKAMYGYSRAEAIGIKIQDLLPEDKQEEYQKYIKEIVEGKRVPTFETQRVTKDDQILDVSITVTVLKNETKKPYAIATTERDITARKSMEKKYQDLYDNSPDMYVSIQPEDAKIINCNNTIATKLGYSKEELIGQPVYFAY